MTTPNNEAPAGPDIASAPAPQQSTATDELDGLLREFDSGSGQQPHAPTGDSANASFAERLTALAAERDRRLAEHLSQARGDTDESVVDRSDRLAQLEQFAAGIEQERWVQREQADAQQVFARGTELLQENAPWLPGDYATSWLRNEYQTADGLADAWDNRHASPEHAAAAKREIHRALKRFNAHLRSLPDPAATGAREIVSASVRGAALDKAPKPAPLSFDGMSDHDFAASVQKKFGFRPKLDGV